MILKTENLTKYYGKTKGIEGLNLELEEGEIFGLIGPNGAGKSTTIRSVMNLLQKTDGKVYFKGQPLEQDSKELKKKIGYLPSEVFLYEGMKVSQMLDYHQSWYKEDFSQRREYLCNLLQVDPGKKVEDLSLGNRKKVGIVLAFMHQPELVILDEPTSGLDPIIQKQFRRLLKEEKERGTTMIFSTHVLSEVSEICDRVGIVKDGHLVRVDTVEHISSHTLQHITLSSPDLQAIQTDLGLQNASLTDGVLRFDYDGDVNALLGVLSRYHITHLNIEEPSIEEIFMHYYQ